MPRMMGKVVLKIISGLGLKVKALISIKCESINPRANKIEPINIE